MSPQLLMRIRKELKKKDLLPSVVYYRHRRPLNWDTPQRGVDRYVGYRALWLKVIIRAAFDWVSYRDSTKIELKKEADKAYVWIFGKSTLVNSFENVCRFVDLPPEQLRLWVGQLTKEHVAKIEHLERDSMNQLAIVEATRKLISEMDDSD